MSDIIDSYIDGVMDRCKAANLSPENELLVYTMIADSHTAKQAVWITSPSFLDKTTDAVRRAGAGLAGAGLAGAGLAGAALSVPLTAIFGKRDEKGKKNYLRNMLLGGLGAAAIPGAVGLGKRFVTGYRNATSKPVSLLARRNEDPKYE